MRGDTQLHKKLQRYVTMNMKNDSSCYRVMLMIGWSFVNIVYLIIVIPLWILIWSLHCVCSIPVQCCWVRRSNRNKGLLNDYDERDEKWDVMFDVAGIEKKFSFSCGCAAPVRSRRITKTFKDNGVNKKQVTISEKS